MVCIFSADPVAMYYLSATSEGADLTGYNHPMTLTGLTYVAAHHGGCTTTGH